MASLLQKNDILFAHKALNMIAGLSANARRVAGAIIDHFNRKTGQCDPSVERLAKLLGIDRATVLRATAELCSGKFGLFQKASHGGKFNTASYVPCWDVFRSIVTGWDDGMRADKRVKNVAKTQPRTSQNCDVDGRKTATQTNLNNQSNKPLDVEPVETQAVKPSNSKPVEASQGLGKRNEQPRQRSMLLPLRGGNQASHSQAARTGAERRWNSDLNRLDRSLSARVMLGLGERPDVYDAATEAELQRKGAGLSYALKA
ncbi:MAG: helix-turn-helix domain-containing protein, partial [Brucellaceae bacterium]|nr:helix-turn-helix domain-containing protein [Brucellaceae bacterium]